MDQAIINSLFSVAIVSAISLLGIVLIFTRTKSVRNIVFALVSLSVGVLFGDVLLHILPDLYKNSDPILSSVFVFCGILAFFVIEKYLHIEHSHGFHEYDHAHEHTPENKNVLGPTILAADTLHNFLDGLIITASFMIDAKIGFATTLAVIFHEIPHEIGNIGVLIQAGYSKQRAFIYNMLTSLAAFGGLTVAVLFGGIATGFIDAAMAIAAGGFLYIAGSELVPELHKESRVKQSFEQFIFIIIGFVAMFAVLIFE